MAAAVGFAHRHLNVDGAARRWLTEAVFPVYVLHQTLIVLGAMVLAPLALRPALEGPLHRPPASPHAEKGERGRRRHPPPPPRLHCTASED